LTPGSRIRFRDPGWKKFQVQIWDPDAHQRKFFRDLEAVFRVKKNINSLFKIRIWDPISEIFEIFLTLDPGSGMEKFGFRIKDVESGINIPDLQHWKKDREIYKGLGTKSVMRKGSLSSWNFPKITGYIPHRGI
jgi:hypothetical protein